MDISEKHLRDISETSRSFDDKKKRLPRLLKIASSYEEWIHEIHEERALLKRQMSLIRRLPKRMDDCPHLTGCLCFQRMSYKSIRNKRWLKVPRVFSWLVNWIKDIRSGRESYYQQDISMLRRWLTLYLSDREICRLRSWGVTFDGPLVFQASSMLDCMLLRLCITRI